MTQETQLAPPGAGLPPLERMAASTLLSGMRSLLSKDALSRALRRETANTLALAASLPNALAGQQVLAPRMTGLEDSSRYWSANMVVRHLVMVNSGIRLLAEALASDKPFGLEARIADYKPDPSAGVEQYELLKTEVELYLQLIESLGNLRTVNRHAHPWFGMLDLRGWHALIAMHATAHRRQIQYIVKTLG